MVRTSLHSLAAQTDYRTAAGVANVAMLEQGTRPMTCHYDVLE